MSFGKRQTPPDFARTAAPAMAVAAMRENRSRGRIGYAWALLAITVTVFASGAIMGSSPAFNPSGTTQRKVAEAILVEVLPSLLVVSAIGLALVDLLLKSVGFRVAWAYALLSGGLVGLCYFGVNLGVSSPRLDVLAIVAAIPAAVGGFVLGVFRSR